MLDEESEHMLHSLSLSLLSLSSSTNALFLGVGFTGGVGLATAFLGSGCEELELLPWWEDDCPEEEVLGLLIALLLAYILFRVNRILRAVIAALTIALVMLKLQEVAKITRYNS